MAQGAGAVTVDPEKVELFSRLTTNLLANSETPALRACLRAILGKVVVGNKMIRVIGSKDVLVGVVMDKNASRDNAHGLVPDWRPSVDETDNYVSAGAL